MVCVKCQKKLDKLITPDSWKDGARNITKGSDGGRKIGGNMLIEKKKLSSFDPYNSKCKICKGKVAVSSIYCHACAYKQGICSMCGIKILNTKFYRQSDV